MQVAAIQPDLVFEGAAENLAHDEQLVEKAAGAGARLVLLPEMFATGFSMNVDVVAEPLDGPSASFLIRQARRLDVHLGGSLPLVVPGSDRPVNRFLLAAPDGGLHAYDKIHLFSPGREHECYRAGAERRSFEVDGLRVTPFVCYDLRFADRFWEAATETDLYVVVANWPAVRQAHWSTLLRARAIENQAYVVGVNRVGSGDGIDYVGGSVVVDPFGEVLAEGGDQEEIVVAEVDAARVAAARRRFPFVADR